MNMSLIIVKGKYGAIDNDDSSCHGYYIIKFSSSPYTLQVELSIDERVISSGELVHEVNYFFPIKINSHYYYLQRTKPINTIVYLSTIINDNVNVICYDSRDFVPPRLRYISQK